MQTTGGLGCADADQRCDYYDMNGIPDIVWDGVVHQVGSPDDDVDGTNFQTIINERLAEESPISVTVTSYRFFGGEPYLTIEIEVFEEITSLVGTNLRVGVCENGLYHSPPSANYHNVLRDMIQDIPLTVQHVGEIQEVTVPLELSADWDRSELWAFAFVQRDSDHLIYNSGSTFVTPYSLYVETDGGQSSIIDSSHTFGMTQITHTGSAAHQTLDLSLDTSTLPEGWDAYFTINGTDMTFATVTLGQLEGPTNLTVTIIPGDEGSYGNAILNLHSHSGEMPDVDIPYSGVLLGADLLIVASDSYARYAEDYFGSAVEAAGRSYAVWDHSHTPITEVSMSNFDAIIWYSGDTGPGLSEADRTEIESYLDRGGNMLFSGQNLARRTVEAGASSWLINVLRTFFMSSGEGASLVAGVEGDPVSDGFSLDLQGGDGAGNYSEPDVVTSFGSIEQSAPLFSYPSTNRNAGTRVSYEGYKHIFLGFGFESINSVTDRNALMDRCLDWLIGEPSPVEDVLPQMADLYQNLPNPFNPRTTIAFHLPVQMKVSLSVYDISGRLVEVLLDHEMGQMGRNEIVWAGADASGRTLPSGTYFYRLQGTDFEETKRMMLLK